METETIIIGGGQAGLSVARYLKERGKTFLILEKNSAVGDSWRNRYDSLTLDSYAHYSHLEGYLFPGDQSRQPSKDEVADYLASFAKKFDLSPIHGVEVTRIEKSGNDFSVFAKDGTIYRAKNVVLATGPFHTAVVPASANRVPGHVFQIHSSAYKNPSQLKPGMTLVVGGGNSGAEIVSELSESGRHVCFSFSGKFKSVPSSRFSQWMAYVLGLAHVPKRSLLGKVVMWYTMRKAVGVDSKKLLSDANVTAVGRFYGVEDDIVICDRAELPDIQNIIWATGYESDFSLLAISGFDPKSEHRGATNIDGLYVMNIRWQWAKSSSHLAGVSRDAKHIANSIASKNTRKRAR